MPITIAVALSGALLHGQAPSESQVKAVYLLNFARFTTWPQPEAAEPDEFDVCVLGSDPFGAVLDATFADETVGGKRVAARRIASPDAAGPCRVVFISATERPELPRILQTIQKGRALTVSDLPGFVDQGGMIEFVPEGRRVRFAVNVAAADRSGLLLSSELLRVALKVKTASKPRG
ncbi:MAG TPA: YfiR family protein [Vicinamibacterales bacterium]|nr:YfiR family protein [Vicinamibacterales bacterium]